MVNDSEVLQAMEKNLGKKGRFIPYSESRGVIKGVMPYEELTELLNDAVKKASELAEEIYSGCKAMRPVKEKKHDGCKFCDYKDICRYKD